eukprot:12885707-Prorocentrum_lima.AAC.1
MSWDKGPRKTNGGNFVRENITPSGTFGNTDCDNPRWHLVPHPGEILRSVEILTRSSTGWLRRGRNPVPGAVTGLS